MKSLSLLTEKIREWNSMGLSLLPSLQIAVIHSSGYEKEVIQFLDVLGCKQLLYNQKIEKINPKIQNQSKSQKKQHHEPQQIKIKQKEEQSKQQKVSQQKGITISQQRKSLLNQWDNRLSDCIYAIYIGHEKIQARVHVIIDQQKSGKIDDESLKSTKKIIQRLKRNKSIILVNFNSTIYRLDNMSDHIEQFGLSFKTKQRQIKADHIVLHGNNKIQKYSKSKSNKSISKSKSKNNQTQNSSNLINLKQENQSIINKNQLSVMNQNQPSNQLNQVNKPSQIKPHVKASLINLPKDSTLLKVNPQFTLNVKSQLNSLFPFKQVNFTQQILKQIQKKYIHLYGVDINKNFNQMKLYHKHLLFQLKRYHQLFQFIDKLQTKNQQMESQQIQPNIQLIKSKKEKDLTSYGLNCLHQAKQYLIASLMGTYSNIQMYRYAKKSQNSKLTLITNKRSLHWQIMEIMNQIWDIEGDFLLKQLQKMPLSYIKQRYKMLDYQTIGGFMPSSCFQAIFSGPLKKIVQHIFQTLQIIQLKILNQIKNVFQYFFQMTNLCDEIVQRQCNQIKLLCQKFRKQTQKVLKSLIQFISVSHEQFWSFKQVKSSLYSADQQIYIQIKYIGKNYVKKVFDNIKQTLPRLIGQNLLKQIVSWFSSKSVEIFMEIVLTKGLQIQVTNYEKHKLQKIKFNEKRINQLVYYFSLKTSSETGIKNLHQNLQKNWKRMFKNNNQSVKLQIQQKSNDKNKGGFLAWARNLIKRNKKTQIKRSSSQQKDQKFANKITKDQNPQQNQQKKLLTLTQKNWLLIINIDKSVQIQKIQRSSEEGFPDRLRPSIWLYLAKKQISNQSIKKIQQYLDIANNVTNESEKAQIKQIYKQIDKDINRTPPPNLFRKGYLKQTITRILQAYSIYDKSLGYTQGMNFIVGIILCVLTHYGQNCQYAESTIKSKTYFQILQNQCFLIFMYIMQNKGLRKIMFLERNTITDLCVRLEDYIKKKSPIMFQKIERSGFTIEMIFSGALISGLTTSEIQFNLQKRVVDLLLSYQFNILYKIIGQFTCAAESLCQNMQTQNLYYFLKGKVYNDVYKQIGNEGLAKLFHNI